MEFHAGIIILFILVLPIVSVILQHIILCYFMKLGQRVRALTQVACFFVKTFLPHFDLSACHALQW